MVIRFAAIRIANIIQIMLNLDMYAWIMRAKTMSVTDDILKTDYSFQFDEKRKALVVQSHYKYGRAGRNFATGNVDAIGSLEKCLAKFKETGNTEYLLDVANYAMFRYMWPQRGEYFKHTDSDESAGIVGMSVNEMEIYK
jgi:hypothetical protein